MNKHKYISIAGSTIMVRVTGFEQRNFHWSEMDRAIAYRDLLCDQVDLNTASREPAPVRQPHAKPAKRKKEKLPPGVCRVNQTKISPNGYPLEFAAYKATWMTWVEQDGKHVRRQRSKHFSVNRYGEEQARLMAIEYRAKMEKKWHDYRSG